VRPNGGGDHDRIESVLARVGLLENEGHGARSGGDHS
jgi:hypothetical protein